MKDTWPVTQAASARTQRNGLLMMMAAAAVDSTSGLFTRVLPFDGFTLTCGRGFFACCTLVLLLLWRERGNTLNALASIGRWGLLMAVLNALGMLVNVLSLTYTGVANFFMIFATAPFAAAIAAWLVLREKLDTATLLAAIAGFIGIAIMMVSGARGGGLVGDVLAMACVGIYSMLILIVRRHQFTDMLPILCVTTFTSGLITLPFANFAPVQPSQWLMLGLFGALQSAGGNLLIFGAMRRISAAQAGLLGILNAAFAPMWVFAVLGEVPSAAAITGGSVIITAALVHLWWIMRSQPATAAGA